MQKEKETNVVSPEKKSKKKNTVDKKTEKEKELIQEAAKKQGLTVTDFILKMTKEKENA